VDKERERRLNQLLIDALDQPPSERRRFLEAACGDDRALAEEAAKLLEREDDLGTFLERPVFGVPGVEAALGGVGAIPKLDRIGPYRLLNVLGEGGMGEVYLAEQTSPVHRRVALKLVPASLRSSEAVARFTAERQAMARLSHPNVGRMLEAGTTDDGFPFFAMELVEGPPITDYCDSRELGLEERLELFAVVCQGVQHAHQKQVLHRDLKPSNVLVEEVDGRAVPKIIDFGVAKALDQPLTELTLSTGERVIGTPAYMSPEALEGGGDVDTRTDVYSLGILLYELLAGTRPFEAEDRSLGRLLRRITDEEAPAPSACHAGLDPQIQKLLARRRGLSPAELGRALAEGLDWIVLRAIARDRGDRYGSAAELAAEIERYLTHQPLEVGPPSFRYRAGKFVRRHRTAVAAAGAALTILVLGAVGTSMGMLRAMRAEEQAMAQAKAAEEARGEAEEVADFLVDLFRASNPFESSPGPPRTADEITARELLDLGAARVREELGDQPLTRARLLAVIGDVYENLGLYDEALPLVEEALDLHLANPETDPVIVGDTFLELGEISTRRGELDRAREMAHEALELLPELSAAPGQPNDADAFELLGDVERKRGRYEEAEGYLRRALEIVERNLDLGLARELQLIGVLNSLANLNFSRGRYGEAEALFRRILSKLRETHPPGHPRIAQAVGSLGIAVASQGRLEEAAPLFEEALERKRELLGDEHPDVAESLNNLGVLYRDLDRREEALELHREALEIRRQALGPDHPRVAWSLHHIGVLESELGDAEKALELHREALGIRERAWGRSHPEVARSLHQLARLALQKGRVDEAREFAERTLEIREETYDGDHEEIAWAAHQLSKILTREGETERARRLLERAIAILEERLPNYDELPEMRRELAALDR